MLNTCSIPGIRCNRYWLWICYIKKNYLRFLRFNICPMGRHMYVTSELCEGYSGRGLMHTLGLNQLMFAYLRILHRLRMQNWMPKSKELPELYAVNSLYNDTIGSQQKCRCFKYVGILNNKETRWKIFIYMD